MRLGKVGVLLLLAGCNEAPKPETDVERATGSSALTADRAVVVARRGDAPGETDLWIVPPNGEARLLAPAPGPDDMPTALPDGRIAFVSARTTVASIWIVDPLNGTTE